MVLNFGGSENVLSGGAGRTDLRRTPCSGPYLAPRASPRGRGWCPVIVEAGCAGHSVMVL